MVGCLSYELPDVSENHVKLTSMQKMMWFILGALGKYGYKRYQGHVMQSVYVGSKFTHSWEAKCTISDFIY